MDSISTVNSHERLFMNSLLQNKERSNNKKNQEKTAQGSENDAPSESGSGDDSSPSPDNKLHVEFTEAEIITDENSTVTKVNMYNNLKCSARIISGTKSSFYQFEYDRS